MDNYKIIWQGKRQIAEFYGDLTMAVLGQALKTVYDDSRSASMRQNIVDFSHVENFLITESDVVTPASYAIGNQADKMHRLYRAFVVKTNKELDFVIKYKKMVETHDLISVGIFYSRQAAEAWLEQNE